MATLRCEQGIGEKLRVGIGLVAASIGLLGIAACGASSNKQAIIVFTEQALAIELERNKSAFELGNVSPMFQVASQYIQVITQLKVRLVALESPRETQIIKDILVEVYSQEQSAIRQVYEAPSFGCDSSTRKYGCRGENVWRGFYPPHYQR